MSVEIDTSGFDKLKNNMEELKGEREVELNDLFTSDFMLKCSTFNSFEEMVGSSNFKVESEEDLKAIPDNEWDEFISNNTSYESWEQMQKEAAINYTKRLLYKGL